MGKKEIDIEKLIKYWIETSDDDFETMMAMFETKRFSWSLFVGHLMIEKLLKAYYVKSKQNLLRKYANMFSTPKQNRLFLNHNITIINNALVNITTLRIT